MYHILPFPTNQLDEIMGIRLEIDTDQCDALGWRALAAFVAVMQSPRVPRSIAVHTAVGSDEELKELRPTSALAAPYASIAPADNPATGTDPDLASFGVGNALGGTVTVASPAAVPAAGAVPSLPPATPPAANVAATAASGQASPVPLDKRGLPWDHRIHSSSKAVNADGTWRNKRGVAEDQLATVEAELRSVMAIPAAAVPLPPGPSALPPPPPGDTAMTFVKLMPKVTAAVAAGTVTIDHVNAVLKQYGFPHLPALATKPDWVPKIHDELFGGGA